jgi:hypothetical protein
MALEERAWRDVKVHGLTLLYHLVNDENKYKEILFRFNKNISSI